MGKKVDFKPLASEVILINEEQRVGGTVDCIGRIGDDLVVIDWKTSKYGPYKEQIIQIASMFICMNKRSLKQM